VHSDRLIPMPTRNLTELIAALSLCDLFIGTDGGAMHLAAALNKKILGMFENRPGKLNHWYPWCAPNLVVHGFDTEHTDVDQITLKQMIKALAKIV